MTIIESEFSGEQFISIPRPPINTSRQSGPNRTEVTDEHGLVAVFTDGSRTVRVRRVERTFVEQISIGGIQDDFNRTVIDGWGNTVASGKWAIRTGADADFSVTPGVGKMRLSTVNASRRIAPSSYGYDYGFLDAQVSVRTDKAGVGADQQACIMGMYQGTNDHYLAVLGFEPGVGVVDEAFDDRVSFSGWGSTPEGFAWTHVGGVTTDYQVGSETVGYGTMDLSAVSSSRRSIIQIPGAHDHSILTTFSNRAVTGGSIWSGVILRYTDASNHYLVRVRRPPSGNAELSVQKVEGGVFTDLDTYDLGVEMTGSNQWWRLRCQIVGNAIQARAWQDITSEPGSWQIDITDETHATGDKMGVRSILSADYTGSFPHRVYYSGFDVVDLTHTDGFPVSLEIQKRAGGAVTTLAGPVELDDKRSSLSQLFTIRFRIEDGTLQASAWRTSEPEEWLLEVNDSTFTQGDVGLRGILQDGYTGALPVTMEFSSYAVLAEWVNPPTITHDWWVYLLDEPYSGGPIPTDWLYERLHYGDPDVLSVAAQYVANAASGVNFKVGNYGGDPIRQLGGGEPWFGDANYGPRDGGGARIEGGDFNDFLGANAVYEIPDDDDVTDAPEIDQAVSLDCSGFVRMVFGHRLGFKMELSHVWDDGRIPRTSSAQATDGPGVVIHSKASQFTALELAKIAIGDVVFFDATAGDDEEEGQIDHNGIYMGVDTNGDMLFVSSRKTINGPTFSAVGGTSKLNGSGLYARQLRSVRRY